MKSREKNKGQGLETERQTSGDWRTESKLVWLEPIEMGGWVKSVRGPIEMGGGG